MLEHVLFGLLELQPVATPIDTNDDAASMMPAVRSTVPKIVLCVVTLVAVVRAATATPPDDGNAITEAAAREVYRDVTSRERSMRREAAVKFPGDLWSQDDDFHERENEQVRSLAKSKSMRFSDVVRAIDDGMRAHWPSSVQPIATVPPCRPRLSY